MDGSYTWGKEFEATDLVPLRLFRSSNSPVRRRYDSSPSSTSLHQESYLLNLTLNRLAWSAMPSSANVGSLFGSFAESCNFSTKVFLASSKLFLQCSSWPTLIGHFCASGYFFNDAEYHWRTCTKARSGSKDQCIVSLMAGGYSKLQSVSERSTY